MSKIKIHITEDEFIVSKNLENQLISLGYEVIGCSSSGEDTLVDIEKNIPDLILMDIMLAGKLDGIQTANIIAEKYDIPLIFLTAYSSDEIYKRAQKANPYAYLLKPFEDRELEINISITLKKHKLEKNLKIKREKLEALRISQDDIIIEKSESLALKNKELDSEIIARERLEVVNQNQDDLIIEKSDELIIINKELDSEIITRERLEVVNQNQDDLIIKKSDALASKNKELDKQIIAREKVEQKNKILAEVIEKSGSHILITNEKAIIEYVNPEMLAFLDYTLEELCGKKPSILKPKNYPSFIYKQMWKTLLSGNVYRGDFVNVKKNGERYSSQNIVVPFFNNKKITHYAFIGEDVTTQRENERMGLTLLEAEKSRISKELHDGVGQTLTAIKFGIGSLLNDEKLKDNNVINTLKNQIEDSISEVREVSFVLMPSILEDYGLESALNKLINNIKSTTNLKINLSVANLKRLKPDYEVNLYRITQELLNNAIKHSVCSEIKIKIKTNNNWISVVFKDNGVGFNLSEKDSIKVNKTGGQGIFNINNRVKALFGFIDFTSMKDVGTYVEILIPLNDE